MLSHLVRASLEKILNTALAADPNSAQRLRSVRDTCVAIHLQELPEPLIISFHSEHLILLGADYDARDAEIWLSFFDLAQLADTAGATQAIQQGRLRVTGDPLLLQRAAAVFKELEIDWEDFLANYVGDVPAYLLSQKILAVIKRVQQSRWQQRMQDILIAELKLLASPVELKVIQELCTVTAEQLTQLEQRLAVLDEVKNNLAKGV